MLTHSNNGPSVPVQLLGRGLFHSAGGYFTVQGGAKFDRQWLRVLHNRPGIHYNNYEERPTVHSEISTEHLQIHLSNPCTNPSFNTNTADNISTRNIHKTSFPLKHQLRGKTLLFREAYMYMKVRWYSE